MTISNTRLTGTAWLQHFISSYGYLAIVLLMTAESACIPVPSELTMPFGGAMAAGAVAGLIGVLVIAGIVAVIVRRRKRPPATRPGPAADPVSASASERRRKD